MTQYVIRRLLLIPPTFIGITFMVFLITRIVPGGPIERAIAQAQQMSEMGGNDSGPMTNALSEDQLEQLREFYGFNDPLLISYFKWFGKLLQLDFGTSTRYSDPVLATITERLPVSAFYGIMTMLITYIVCIPLGVIKAIKHNTHLDNITSIVVFIGYAIPAYVVAIIVLVYFGSELQWFPLSGFTSDDFEDFTLGEQIIDVLYHATLPLVAYVIGNFAVMTFMMKNALMENLAADYVRTAMAKGFSFNGAVFMHAFRNSLIPIATHFGNNISFIIAGSFLIEKIFNIDGIGLLGFESIIERDYPVVMGILVISSILLLLGNIISDICVALVDPRVQFH